MANDTISQTVLFPVCRTILFEEVRPMHYRELTDKALSRLSVDKADLNIHRQIEDVREQLPKHDGIAYVGNPYCVMYLKVFVSPPTLLNNITPLVIAANINDSIRACYEAILRSSSMVNKFNIPIETRAKKRARGLVTEHHIVGWFKTHWAELVLDPDNIGLWDKPCSHDFKLKLPTGITMVDVAGEDYRHEFGLTPGKKPTDIHICAKITDTDDCIVVYGYVGGRQFSNGVLAEETQPIQKMIFYLNCLKYGYDYSLFKLPIS